MTSTSRVVILEDSSGPLMVLERYALPSGLNFAGAYQELLKYIEERADASYTWGYFPGIVDPNDPYPECQKLEKDLQESLVSQFPTEQQDLHLAFIRAASQRPVSEFGGLHIDADQGVMHKRDASTMDKNILRVLVNLDSLNPRRLGYTKQTAEELRSQGLDIPKDHYQEIKLPDHIKLESIEIPPRELGHIYVLKFWSDIVPHAGLTDDSGHFLAAYGMYLDKLSNPLSGEL